MKISKSGGSSGLSVKAKTSPVSAGATPKRLGNSDNTAFVVIPGATSKRVGYSAPATIVETGFASPANKPSGAGAVLRPEDKSVGWEEN